MESDFQLQFLDLFLILWVNTLAYDALVLFYFLYLYLQLHQLMPSVMTCLVAKRLGNKFSDDHWELRNFTANLVALICKR